MEASHLAYDAFIFTVETLARSPEEQCEAMGDCNTAWELRDDALAGRYLVGSGLFTAQQEPAVLAFLAAVHKMPVNDMPAGSGRAPNLAVMRHAAWEPIRSLSKTLLAALAWRLMRTVRSLALRTACHNFTYGLPAQTPIVAG